MSHLTVCVLGLCCGIVVSVAVADPAMGGREIATTPPAQLKVPTLQGSAHTVLGTAVRRMLPGWLEADSRMEAATLWEDALRHRASRASPLLAELYRANAEPIFASREGLLPSGEVVVEALGDPARLNSLTRKGAEGDSPARSALGLLERLREAPPPQPVPLELDDRKLLRAWRDSGGAPQRVLTSLVDAGELTGTMVTLRDQRLAHSAREVRDRADLEVLLAEAALKVGARLKHRPRTAEIHQDARGNYLSPDALWLGREPVLNGFQAQALLAAAADGSDTLRHHLRALEPGAPEYRRLMTATRDLARICEAGGWSRLSTPWGRRGRRWQNKPAIVALQRRLRLEGFYRGRPTGEYGDSTVKAVRRYQRALQLKETGVFDPEVASALNVPCDARLRVLQLNLHRWRHTARRGELTRVTVNLPAMEVRLHQNGRLRARFKAVVGSGRSFWSTTSQRRIYPRATPLLSDAIDRVVVNPSWTVPPRIYRLEYKPRIERDPDYLAQSGFMLTASQSGHPVLVQPPGPDNSLGEVKVVFPNKEGIYLHDTNKRDLFRFPRRAFSHGCIRVDRALAFATEILRVDREQAGKAWNKRSLKRFARDDDTRTIVLHHRMPVFLEYYTASVAEDGRTHFHPDIYDYDKRTLASLGHGLPGKLATK